MLSPMTRPVLSAGLRRDLDLLEQLTSDEALRHGGLGVARLAELTGRQKSQVSRALQAMHDEGVVERDPDTLEYRLGWKLFTLVARGAESRLQHAAEPVIRALAQRLAEGVHLCVLRDGDVLTLLTVAPPNSFNGFGWEGRRIPAHCTSAGRALLSDATAEEVAAMFTDERLAASTTPGAARTVAEVIDRIATARRRGYAIVDEEFELGLVGASAPIRDFRGRIVATITVAAPKARLGDRLEETGKLTAESAAEVSRQLGWTGDQPARPLPATHKPS